MKLFDEPTSARPSSLRERILGYLLVAGSVVALITVLLPTRATGSDLAVIACALVGVVLGGLLVALSDGDRRVPTWGLGLTALLGTTMIVVAGVAGGFATSGATDSQFLFIWVTVYAFYFFSLRHALLQLGAVAIGVAVVLSETGSGHEGPARFLVACTTMLVLGLLVRHLRLKGEAAIAEAERRARRDELTGCLNRRGLHERAAVEFSRALREQSPIGFLLVDLDQFTMYNELQGQEAGDELLRHVAKSLESSTRGVDAVARLGADEFGVLLTDAGREDVEEVTRRLIANLRASWEGGPGLTTISIGGCSSQVEHATLNDLWRSAARALQVARQTGGDQARLAQDPVGGGATPAG